MNNRRQGETHLGVLEAFKGNRNFGSSFNKDKLKEVVIHLRIFLETLMISFLSQWVVEAEEGSSNKNRHEEKTSH